MTEIIDALERMIEKNDRKIAELEAKNKRIDARMESIVADARRVQRMNAEFIERAKKQYGM